jgi:hypothetical protein
MADSKLSQLPAASSVAGADLAGLSLPTLPSAMVAA